MAMFVRKAVVLFFEPKILFAFGLFFGLVIRPYWEFAQYISAVFFVLAVVSYWFPEWSTGLVRKLIEVVVDFFDRLIN
ncbi:MAG: hypothetical protein ABJN98_11945 [Roseibium sp.]